MSKARESDQRVTSFGIRPLFFRLLCVSRGIYNFTLEKNQYTHTIALVAYFERKQVSCYLAQILPISTHRKFGYWGLTPYI